MNSRRNTARRIRHAIVPVTVACVLMLAACGSQSSSSTKSSTNANYVNHLEYSDCMRSHGVSNFPDPSPLGGIDIRKLGFTEIQSPMFRAAADTCAKLLAGAGPPPGPGFNEQQLQQMVAKARCIRQHSFPNFPDPDASGDNIGLGTSPAGWNPDAPAEIKARKACAMVGTGIPGWLVSWNGSAR